MNDDVVNVQTGLILFRLPFILVGYILGFILIDSQPFQCVEHLHSVYKLPEREKVIILAYIYFL